MQQPVSRRDVYSPSLSASIGGRDVELVSASMDRSLPDPLVGGSLTAASGELVAVEGADVAQTVATPWDPGSVWPPVPETSASVDMDTGAGPVSILRGGRVISASGGTSGREVEVEVADQYQSLDKTISWGPVAEAMPSMSEGVIARYVGMQSVYVTDRILRHCGWYSTPPNPGYGMLSVPAQGSLWPERGTVVTANRPDGGGYPGWSNTPWGVGVIDTDATYLLGGPGYSIQSRGRVELTAMTAPRPGEGTSRIDLLNDSGNLLARMSWSETSGHLYLRNTAGTMSAAVSVPRSDGLLYATVEYASSTSAYVTIRSGGNSVGAAVTGIPQIVTTSAISNATIVANSLSGGFMVAFPSVAGTLESWTPNAVLYPRTASRNTLKVLPPVEGASCVDLLAQQCEAECATYWIDETGVLRWWDLARLEGRPVAAELTSDDDIAEAGFTWSHSLPQVKSRVGVEWREPLREWSWRTATDLWQGSGTTTRPNEATPSGPSEQWINVPNDEVWIMPDLTLNRVGDTYDGFNDGLHSWYGAIVDRGDGQDTWAQNHGSFLVTAEKVTDTAFKVSTIWTGDRTATQQTLTEYVGVEMWRRWLDYNLPIIRGKAKFMFTDRVTYSAQSGPATAPEHTISAGWWIQSEEQAQYTADYAAQRLTVAQPVLSSVALIPVPGLQLGDVVEVRDEHVTRLTIRGLVIEDSRSINADMGMDHAVAIRPTYITRNGVSWHAWADVARPKTTSQWATNQASTWAEWGAAPLLKEDVL